MPLHDGARQESKRLATKLSLTTAQVFVKSGADLEQAELALDSATAVGPGNDGARLTQIIGGTGA